MTVGQIATLALVGALLLFSIVALGLYRDHRRTKRIKETMTAPAPHTDHHADDHHDEHAEDHGHEEHASETSSSDTSSGRSSIWRYWWAWAPVLFLTIGLTALVTIVPPEVYENVTRVIPEPVLSFVTDIALLILVGILVGSIAYLVVLIIISMISPGAMKPNHLALTFFAVVVTLGLVSSARAQIVETMWWPFSESAAAAACPGTSELLPLRAGEEPRVISANGCELRWVVESGCVAFLNRAGEVVIDRACVRGDVVVTAYSIYSVQAVTAEATISHTLCIPHSPRTSLYVCF